MYKKENEKLELFGFCNSDLAGYVGDMKSTSDYAFMLGSGIFSSVSKKTRKGDAFFHGS